MPNLRLAVLVILLTGAFTPPVAASWQVEPVAVGTKPELELTADDRPCLAWMVEDHSGSVEVGCRTTAGQWDITTVAAGYFYAPLDLALDSTAVFWVAYHDHDAQDAAVAHGAPGGWQVETIPSPGHDGWDPSLAIGPDGRTHLASIDPSQFGSDDGVEYARREADCAGNCWMVEPVGTGPIPYEFGTALEVAADGTVLLAYHDGSNRRETSGAGADLWLATRHATGWDREAIVTEGDVGKFPALALAADGTLHLVALRWLTATTAEVVWARHAPDGSWQIEVVGGLDDFRVAHLGARRSVDIALDSDDRPVIAWCDRSRLRLAERRDGGWIEETVVEQTASDLVFGQLVSLSIATDGALHVTFYELPVSPSSSTGTVYWASRDAVPTADPHVRRGDRRRAP